jgi:hypothetical protein
MAGRSTRSGLAPDGFVEARVATHLMWRLCSRFHAVVSTRGAAKTPLWRGLAVASVGADLVGARWLRRDREFHLGPRLVVDAADLALWCMAAGDDPDTTSDSVIPGVGLAAEAGARLGLRGLVVPAVSASVMAIVRKRRGHDLRLWQVGWQVMGVIGGIGLSVSAARRRLAVEEEHRRDLEARMQAGQLAGYHALVTAADPVADRLQRATALVDLGGEGQRRTSSVNAWKATLAEVTRERAAFLADVLMLWQSAHNLHPDLQTMVRLAIEPGSGTVLLTLSQADELRRALDTLDLRGTVAVELADPTESRRPDGRRDLIVADQLVSLGRPAESLSAIYDAVPTAFVMSTLWFLPPLSDTREGLPPGGAAVPVVLSSAAALWSAVRANREGLVPRRPSILLSGIATVVYTLTSSRMAKNPHSPDGASWFPWMLALQGYELVTEHCGPDLPALELRMARLGAAAVVGLGWLRSPPPRSGRALLSEVVWPLGIGIWAGATARAIKADAARLAEEIRSQDAMSVATAFAEGRQQVIEYFKHELESTELELESHGRAMDPRQRDEAQRRLAEVRKDLDELVGSGAPG